MNRAVEAKNPRKIARGNFFLAKKRVSSSQCWPARVRPGVQNRYYVFKKNMKVNKKKALCTVRKAAQKKFSNGVIWLQRTS